MRNYLLTSREREILKKFIEEDVKLDGFRVLIHLITKHLDRIKDDLALIEKALHKYSNQKLGL